MNPPSDRPASWLERWWLLAAIPLAVWCIVGLQVAELPSEVLRSRWMALVEASFELAYLVPKLLAWPLLFTTGVAVLAATATTRPSWRRRWWRLAPLLSAIPASHAYAILVRYEGFSGDAPLGALFVGFWLFVSVTVLRLGAPRTSGRWPLLVRAAPLVAALVASLATFKLNERIYKDEYETLHLAVLEAGATLMGVAMLHAAQWSVGQRARRRWATAGIGGAILLLASLAAQAAGKAEAVRPYVNTYTSLGRSRAVFEPIAIFEAGTQRSPEPDPDGVERLREAFGAPEFPADFRLRDYNVLLITVEATRFDFTSLADPATETTPNLRRLAEMDSLVFSQAISPSSATLQSMGSLLTMQYPSATHLEFWMRSWHGVLLGENVTLAELFTAAGYRTFWVGHDHKHVMNSTILGFSQGFQKRDLVFDPASRKPNDRASSVDERIALKAARALSPPKGDRRPFFGWVFFASPHSPYRARDADLQDADPSVRYESEIRYMDEQLGVLLDALEERALIDKTIIVFLSDHGEEFGEHGGRLHKRTLYEESIHVPLVIRIPGVAGRRIEQPVSTLYTFPWLLSRDEGELGAAARDKLQTEFGPMLRATGGGVVAELLGHDRMLSVLIYPELRVHFDFRTRLREAYDTTVDPYEQEDLMLRDPQRVLPLLDHLDAYRTVRRGLQRFTWDLEKTVPTEHDLTLNRLAPVPSPKKPVRRHAPIPPSVAPPPVNQ